MTKKSKLILSSVAAIAMSASLAIGGTFALFTSESDVNVSISSGKVDVVAYAENLTLYSPKEINLDGTIKDDTNAANDETSTFANGGTAALTENTVTLKKMTPGDKVTFDIVVKNNSTVKVQYQTKFEVREGLDLFSGLNVTFDKGTDHEKIFYGITTSYNSWKELSPETTNVGETEVTIELPANAGNAYQGLECKLAFTVNAVQGNAAVADLDDSTVYLYNANDLVLFERSVNNGNSYAGKTVKLMNDINLAGIAWKPIGQTGATQFQGTFDGQGYTISNMTVNNPSESENVSSGFFGWLENTTGVVVKNVKFKNANVTGSHYVGVVAGYLSGTITDCAVSNSTVIGINMNNDANGDKIGGLVGYINGGTVSRNRVANSTIQGNRDIGGITGVFVSGTTFTNNTVSDTTIYYATAKDYASAGKIVSGRLEVAPDSTNVATNVTIRQEIFVHNAYELSLALNATYSQDMTITLANDITLSGEWGAHALKGENNANLIIDGNGKTISGLTSNTYTNINGFNSNGLVTSIKPGLSSVTFKNLTVSGANLTNNGGGNAASGVFVGDINTVKTTFENCTVTGANVNSNAYAAGFVGYVQDVYVTDPVRNCPLTLKNCTVTGSTFNGSDATGALVGLNNGSTIITGATVTGNTINGGAGYSAAALVGSSIGGTTATNVTVSNNSFTITSTNYQVDNSTYGYIYKNGNTYSVNGTELTAQS